MYQDAQGSKDEVEGARGTLCGVQWGAFQKGLSEGEMHEQKCTREGGTGDGVEAFKVKGMVYVKTEGQEGAQCMRAQNRTCMGWTREADR